MNRLRQNAFTLLEILMSMAILALLIVLFSQIFTAATKTTNIGTMHLDDDSQARRVFDRMADDFSNMFMRKDVDYHFLKQSGNDTFFFFSRAPGYSDCTSTAPTSVNSLVGYRINPRTFQLERLAKQLNWDGGTASGKGSLVYLSYANSGTTPLTASTIAGNWGTAIAADSTDVDYHVIGEGIFRLEFCFLETPPPTGGNTPYVDPPAPTPGTYPFQFSTATASGTTTVTGVVVTIAMLDTTSRKVVPHMNTLVSALTDIPNTPPLADWNITIHSRNFATTAGIPTTMAGQVRVYQRTFYLNTSPSLIAP